MTTTTVSILGVEDLVSTSASGQTTTETTRFYPLPGGMQATRDSSGLTYEGRDLLGTPLAALSLGSGVVNERLRTPYGQARLGVGSGMHTPFGFTGQREDTTPAGSGSGLDDFNARMYDPVVGRFTSADTAQPGLGDPLGSDGYAYVGGMVESAIDPSGHDEIPDETRGGGGTAVINSAPTEGVGGGSSSDGSDGSSVSPDGADAVGGVDAAIWAVYGVLGAAVGAAALYALARQFVTGLSSTGAQREHHYLTSSSAPDDWASPALGTIRPGGVTDPPQLPSIEQGTGRAVHLDSPQPGPTPTANASGGGAVVPPTHITGAGCGCDDGMSEQDPRRIFYRGTTLGSVLEVADNQALDVNRIAANQERAAGGVLQKGVVYVTSQLETAFYYANLAGGTGVGLGPGILQIEVPSGAFDEFAQAHGIAVETPIPGSDVPGGTETRIPFEHVAEFDAFATYSSVDYFNLQGGC